MKYALVTGGSRGLGRAVCLKLAAQGYPVLINYKSNSEAAQETKRLIEEAGGQAELMPFDVSVQAEVEAAVDAWQESHKEDYIAVLVNNAGIRRDNLMIFMQDDDWNSVLNTNLNSFFFLTRRLLKDMLSKRWGRIVNMASLSGIKGLPGQTNYSAAKGGMIAATKALSQEVARKNVTVNAVAPGLVLSPMNASLSTQDLAAFQEETPLGKLIAPEQVAEAVCYLAEAQMITGQILSVDGGIVI